MNFDPQTAVEWLRYCSDNHPQCHYDPHFRLPKRVLDCSERLKSSRICLVETKEDHRAEYVALSYVWGGQQPFLTLSANIAEHTVEIDINTLPHTLQDAVHVTRAIGLRYLWIDALCIIQDSTKDKATEIGLMNQYYKNAFCVIAATMSEDVMEGFLMTNVAGPLSSNIPPPDDITPQADLKHQVPFFSPDGEAGFLFLEANPTLFDAIFTPLNRRCWALQERLLCPRILRFTTPSSFSLLCNSTERFAGNITYGATSTDDSHRMMQPKGIDGPTQKSDVTSTKIHDSWLGIVAAYTGMKTSVPGDCLIAIAALAEEYHSWNPALGRYLAGHWAEHLEYSLDWIVVAPYHEMGTYRAPSWSWASVEGATYLNSSIHESKGEPQIQILECATSLAEVTLPFGALTNGHLKIRARLQQVGWRRQDDYYASIYHISNEEVNKDEEEKDKTEPQEIAQAYPDTIENFPPSENDATINETVFLIDLITYGTTNSRVFSLVLRKCRENTFRRVGYTRRDFSYVSTSDMIEEKVFYLI